MTNVPLVVSNLALNDSGAFAANFEGSVNFSGAAAELFISQPAVSKHFAELERYLDVQLVVRQPRDGSLTGAGVWRRRRKGVRA